MVLFLQVPRLPGTLAVALKDNLEDLIKKHPYHGVLYFTARCLCSLGRTDAAAARTVVSLLRRFKILLLTCLKKVRRTFSDARIRCMCTYGAYPDIFPPSSANCSCSGAQLDSL